MRYSCCACDYAILVIVSTSLPVRSQTDFSVLSLLCPWWCTVFARWVQLHWWTEIIQRTWYCSIAWSVVAVQLLCGLPRNQAKLGGSLLQTFSYWRHPRFWHLQWPALNLSSLQHQFLWMYIRDFPSNRWQNSGLASDLFKWLAGQICLKKQLFLAKVQRLDSILYNCQTAQLEAWPTCPN